MKCIIHIIYFESHCNVLVYVIKNIDKCIVFSFKMYKNTIILVSIKIINYANLYYKIWLSIKYLYYIYYIFLIITI